MPGILTLLHRAGVSINSIQTIAVSRGPGSFTGMKGGIATALGLARATGSRLISVSLFDAIAASVNYPDCTVIIALGRGQFGVQRFESEASVSSPISVSGQELKHLERKPGPFLFCGSPDGLIEFDVSEFSTVHSNLAELVAMHASFVSSDEPFEPIYLGK